MISWKASNRGQASLRGGPWEFPQSSDGFINASSRDMLLAGQGVTQQNSREAVDLAASLRYPSHMVKAWGGGSRGERYNR